MYAYVINKNLKFNKFIFVERAKLNLDSCPRNKLSKKIYAYLFIYLFQNIAYWYLNLTLMCDIQLTMLVTFNFWFFRIEEPPVLGIEKTLKELRIFMKCPTNNRQLYRWFFDQFLDFLENHYYVSKQVLWFLKIMIMFIE